MFKKKILDYIYKHDLIPEKSKLLAGVSGGPDSLVLLHFLHEIKEELGFELVAAHVDHMFRGDESYRDYLFVEKVCREWRIPFEGKRINVPQYMDITGESMQSAARKLRYAFFEEVMDTYELSVLALGHHGDDQVETMLMRITRGATGMARAGIPAKRPLHDCTVIRPFLPASKDEISEYAKQNALIPRIDPSNEKDVYLRNRFRLSVLPFLKRENPKVQEHYQRFSEELFEDEAYLLELAGERLETVWIERKNGYASIQIEPLLAMPKPLQRRAIQLILNYLYIERPSSLSALHIDQLSALFMSPQPSAELHLPDGLIAEKSYNTGIFRFFQKKSPNFFLQVQIPGDTILPNGYKIKAHYIKEKIPESEGNDSFIFRAAKADLPLMVRTRKDGDRMSVKGLGGSKKLKDIFINEKIPLSERNVWPVVTNQKEEVIWLPGLKKSEQGLAGYDDEPSFIYLEYKKLTSSRGQSNG
ncbi:tRNA lysidine(34) synthetase TilS [Peribacillus cavernae]|uniref:tRNA(Ile)-lysidine synthase n=1 Tax=Peribacillus cavernae TaxID=1674310 RepID=A0A3S0W440_9BACI|nr:tRNA lysidine(34) synthetase TilS [Peribacillus cavernae]MDQ0220885.1 tRNA(Ile)-lysidine synthetase-like protein [Peribacillus cavernae]RUQ27298.1 tRNA lysidine(34) synthetase TilS [Peribacillus cavernae]